MSEHFDSGNELEAQHRQLGLASEHHTNQNRVPDEANYLTETTTEKGTSLSFPCVIKFPQVQNIRLPPAEQEAMDVSSETEPHTENVQRSLQGNETFNATKHNKTHGRKCKS
jgi:hypothetical protein